ncbi:MAG: NifU family protein, partial [Actinomycetota bacterium]|nr:NifU family protein [Actinomycetota bacterium]
ELLGIDGSDVRLRLQGSCSGCPSSRMTLKLAIENAIRKAAPEIEEVIAEEEPTEPASPLLKIEPASPLLQIDLGSALGVTPAAAGPEPGGSWEMAGGLPELSGGGLLVKPISGQQILFLALEGRFYGYRPRCPACDGSLDGAVLRGAELACPGCGNRYDAIRAGRCLDAPQLHLEPVPLLVGEDGLVKVALPVAA